MSNTRPTIKEMVLGTSLSGISAAAGAGAVAAVRGGSVSQSASVAGLCTASVFGAVSTLAFFAPRQARRLSNLEIAAVLSLMELFSTTVGCLALRILTEKSTFYAFKPLADATVGLPITLLLLFALEFGVQGLDKNLKSSDCEYKRPR